MRKNLFLSAVILTFSLFALAAFGQTTTVKPSTVAGEVSSIDSTKIVLKTANGDVGVVLSAKTRYFSVPPDNFSTKAAVASAFTDIKVGDKVIVTGILSEDKKSIPANSVYLVSKTTFANKDAKDMEDWRQRGIAGRVLSFDLATKVIKVSVRGLAGERIVSVTPKDSVQYYRYAPETVQLRDAKKSVLTEIEIGDSIRVLGDKNADGSEMTADKIVTGAFRTIGGTITAINVEKNEVTINDFQTKKDVVVVVTDASLLKQFPPEMAARFTGAGGGGGQGGGMRPPTQGGQTPNPQPNPQQQTPGQTPGQGGGMRGGSFDDMLDRFPTVKIADLKVGDQIAVSSAKSNDPSRIRAIKLVSGIEPFIRMAQMQQAQQGGGNRGGGANSNFTIPGLDGFGGN